MTPTKMQPNLVAVPVNRFRENDAPGATNVEVPKNIVTYYAVRCYDGPLSDGQIGSIGYVRDVEFFGTLVANVGRTVDIVEAKRFRGFDDALHAAILSSWGGVTSVVTMIMSGASGSPIAYVDVHTVTADTGWWPRSMIPTLDAARVLLKQL